MDQYRPARSTDSIDRCCCSNPLPSSRLVPSFSPRLLPFAALFQHFSSAFSLRPVTAIRAAAPRPPPLLRRPRRRGYAAGSVADSVADSAGPSKEHGNPLCFSWLTDDIERLDMDASCVARFTVPSRPFSLG